MGFRALSQGLVCPGDLEKQAVEEATEWKNICLALARLGTRESKVEREVEKRKCRHRGEVEERREEREKDRETGRHRET